MTQSQPSTPEKPQDIVLADGQGVFYGIPADQYHGSSFTNRSKLDDFHESRELYHENYVLGKREDEEKEAYKIGRALHAYVLEGSDVFAGRYTHIPEDVYASWGHPNSTAHKAAKLAFQTMNAGKEILKPDEFTQIVAMGEKVRTNPDAAQLLAVGQPEVTMRIRTPKHGFMVQCRADWLNRDGCELTEGQPYIADIKSVASFTARNWKHVWSTHLWKFRYHRQAAFYTGIAEPLLGISRMIFIAVSKTPPYSVVCLEIDEIHMRIAQDEILQDLKELGECYASNNWSDPLPRGIQTVEPSNWQIREAMNGE